MPKDKHGKTIQLYDIVLHQRDYNFNPLMVLITGHTKLNHAIGLIYDGNDVLTDDPIILRYPEGRATVLDWNIVSLDALRERNWYRDMCLPEYC